LAYGFRLQVSSSTFQVSGFRVFNLKPETWNLKLARCAAPRALHSLGGGRSLKIWCATRELDTIAQAFAGTEFTPDLAKRQTVPRVNNLSLLRIECYWDVVVDRPGDW
jgi:hypothetical protein